MTPGRSIQPPSAISLPSIASGSPGAHVICSTGRYLSSQTLGLRRLGFPFASMTGVPSFFSIGTDGRRVLTLVAGHISRVGTKIYEWLGM